jgi:hypothetical protein
MSRLPKRDARPKRLQRYDYIVVFEAPTVYFRKNTIGSSVLWSKKRCAVVPADHHRRSLNIRFALPAQPIDATQALNLSAGIWNAGI